MEQERKTAAGKALERPAEAEHLLELVCQQIVEELGVTSCSLSQWDRVRNVVTTEITYTPHPELERPLHIDTGESYALDEYPTTARVLREQVAIYIRMDDPTADPAEVALLQATGQKANLMLPLMIGDEVIGLLEAFQREQARDFTPEMMARAWTLARQAALVIEGGHLFAAARKEARELATLLEDSAAITASLDLETVLHTVAEQTVRLTGVEGSAVSEYDPASDSVRTWAEYASDRVAVWSVDQPGTAYALKDYPATARVLRQKTAAVLHRDDPQTDPAERLLMEKNGVRSLLMVPMVAYERIIGLIELMTATHRHEFSPSEIALAQTFANQAAVAIENARLYAQSRQQLAELQRASEAQRRLLELMREVGTPVIPIHDRVLILPLIGMVDSERARHFTERLLHAVRSRRARVVLLDITGVPLVDTAVAQAILQAAEATRLLGAEVVLVGVRSDVAQTLVTLGLGMLGVVTKANLQAGMEYALERLGLRIVAQG